MPTSSLWKSIQSRSSLESFLRGKGIFFFVKTFCMIALTLFKPASLAWKVAPVSLFVQVRVMEGMSASS